MKINSHPILLSRDELEKYCCIPNSNLIFLEEYLFRILIHPERKKLLEEKSAFLCAYLPPVELVLFLLQDEVLWTRNRLDKDILTALRECNCIYSAVQRARKNLGFDTRNTLAKVLLYDANQRHASSITYLIENRHGELPQNYSDTFRNAYKDAWCWSSRKLPCSWQPSRYNAVTLLAPRGMPLRNKVDGNSAFLSFLIPLTAMISRMSLPTDVGFCGSYCRASERVKPVEYIPAKAIAAYESGIKVLFVHESSPDLSGLPLRAETYREDSPDRVADEILTAIRNMGFKLRNRSTTRHAAVEMKDSLHRIEREVAICSSDIHRTGNMENAFQIVSASIRELERMGLKFSTLWTECQLLLADYHNHKGDTEKAEKTFVRINRAKKEILPEQLVDLLNRRAVTFQDIFMLSKAERTIKETLRCCDEHSKETAKASGKDLAQKKLEVQRTLAQNHAYLGDPGKAVEEIEALGKLPTDPDGTRYLNYLIHSVCDSRDSARWERIKTTDPSLSLPHISDRCASIYNVHAHLKGFLVFETPSDSIKTADSLFRTSTYQRLLDEPGCDPTMEGTVLQCLGMIYEKNSKESDQTSLKALAEKCYEAAATRLGSLKGVINEVLSAVALAHQAVLTHDTDVAEKAKTRICDALEKTCTDEEEPIWNGMKQIVRKGNQNSLDDCSKLIRLLQRFQWW